jgi:hypothetical protein
MSSSSLAVCDKLVHTFDSTSGGLSNFSNRISREVNNNVSSLKGLSWSGSGDLTAGVGSLISQMDGRIPSSDSVDDILDFINDCPFLSGDSVLKNPIGLVNGMLASVYDKMGEIANSLADSLSLPELGVGKLLDDIMNMMDFSGVNISIPGLDDLISCVSASCGGEFASKISEMTDTLDELYVDFNMDSDPLSANFGNLDLDSIYNKASMTVSEKANMGTVTDALGGIKSEAQDRVSNCVETIKSTTDVFDW